MDKSKKRKKSIAKRVLKIIAIVILELAIYCCIIGLLVYATINVLGAMK